MEKQKPKLTNYDENDIFWRDFINLPNNPYKLENSLKGFKTLFVFPTKAGFLDYPLPLGYMASLIRMNQGHAKILMQEIENYDPKRFTGYNLICFYPMAALFEETMQMSERVKKDYPNSKICAFNSDQHQHEMLLCNPNARDFGRKMIERYPSLDFILIGETESSFIQLCDKLNRRDTEFKDVSSCLYKKNDEIKMSEKPIESVNFEFLPFASRDYLEDGIVSGINQKSPRIQSSRGCVAPCLYCVESCSNITKGGRRRAVLTKGVSKLVDEIEMLQKNYGVVFFNSIDSSFEDPGKRGIERMKKFCEEIIDRRIEASFKIHLRTETVDKLDDNFLDSLKYAGVDIVIPGVESGLEKELKSYRKMTTPEKSAKTIKRLEDYGKFFSILGHMMFSPVLILEDLPKKAEFLKDVHHGWDYLNMSHNVIIFPGTAYYELIKSKGLIPKHDDLCPIIPYHFEDERVRFVSKEMGRLKKTNPEVITLQNLLCDSMNVYSRYFNKMNFHLHQNNGAFENFRRNLKEVLYEVEDKYYSFFMDLVNLAESGYSKERAYLLRQKHIQGVFSDLADRTKNNLKSFLENCERKNLPTNKLYLKTWMTVLTSQVNTSEGRIAIK